MIKTKRNEIGVIKKDPGGRVSVALVYPNTYYIGMSNLAVHTLYKFLNDDPQIVAERFFLSDGKILSEESKRQISEFDIVAFTFSFELDYLNIPALLGKGIPLLRENRNERHPILIAGGPAVTLNPEALSNIFDAIVVGEAEDILENILEAIKTDQKKLDIIIKIGKIRGILTQVPGTRDGVQNIEHVYTRDINKSPTHSVIWTNETEFGHMHLVEVARGCPWKCNFCATPKLYSPYRTRSEKVIWDSIEYGLPHRKHIGLIGADVLGHPNFKDIASELIKRKIKISTSSLRVNRIDKEIAAILAKSGHKRTTLGIEAANDALRKKINKSLNDQTIFDAVKNLASEGITNLKLYFMIGLPCETDEDLISIAKLTSEVRKILLKERASKTLSPNISVVINPFVPKKKTPFAKRNFSGVPYLNDARKKIRPLLQKIPNTKFVYESPRRAEMEYRLSQGGAEISEIIEWEVEKNLNKKFIH